MHKLIGDMSRGKKTRIFLLVGLSILLASLYLAQLENIIVAVGTEGPDIFEVSDPTNLVHLSHLNLEDDARNIYVKDNYAYLADDENGLVIIEVIDPENPTLVADMLWLTFYGISGN